MDLEQLLQQQGRRWAKNQTIPVEQLVIEHSGNASQLDVDGWLDLICHEVKLRKSRGENPELSEYLARFPQLAKELQIQWDINHLLEGFETANVASPTTTSVDSSSPFSVPLEADSCFAQRYQMQRLLGRGANGVVFEAWDMRLKRNIALKRLRTGIDASDEDIERMRSEAEALARIRSPYIVQVFDVGESEGLPYLAMELCQGGSLAKRLDGQSLQPRTAADLVKRIALGLSVAHSHRIVHRDIKPANILLENETDWNPKIVDFGLAKLLDSDNGATMTGTLLGTPAYMAPEQAFGNAKHVGPEADIYSIGAILYECLTGGPPFRSSSKAEILQQVRNEEPLSVRTLQPKIPIDLETITTKCLQKVPSKRYATAQALADDLDRFIQGHPIQARRTGSLERVLRWRQRNPVVAALLGVSVFLLFTIAIGSTAAAIWLRYERDKAVKSQAVALRSEELAIKSEKERRQELYRAYILEARASRQGRQSGQRNFGLTAIRNILKAIPASELRTEQLSELRDEAIASLLLADTGETKDQQLTTTPIYGDIDVDQAMQLVSGHDFEDRTIIRGISGIASEEFKSDKPFGPNFVRFRSISPDGRRCVELAWQTDVSECRMRIWDSESKKWVVDRPTEFLLDQMAIDAKGSRCFARGADDRIHIISLPSGEEVFQSPQRYLDGHTVIAVSPDGTKLAITAKNGISEVIEIESWKIVRTFPEIDNAYSAVWDTQGQGVFFGTESGAIYHWMSSQNSIEEFGKRCEAGVRKLDLSFDGKYIAATSESHNFEIRDTSRGEVLYRTQGDFLGFNLNQKRYAYYKHNHVYAAEIADEPIYRIASHNVNGITFTADGRWILSGGIRGMQVFSANDLALAGSVQTDPCGPIAIHPDGHELISFGIFSKMWRWPIATNSEQHEFKIGPPTRLVVPNLAGLATLEPQYQGRHTHYSPDANKLAICDYRNGRTLVMNLEKEQPPQVFPQLNVGRVTISSDGKWVASAAGIYPSVKVWSMDIGEQVFSLDGPAMAAFSPDDKFLALSFNDCVQLHKTTDWTLSGHYDANVDRAPNGAHAPVAFQQKGCLMAYSPTRQAIRLVEYQSGETIANISGIGEGTVRDLQFSPDGTRIAFATTAGELGIIDLHLLKNQLSELTLTDESLPHRDTTISVVDAKVVIDRGDSFPKPEKWSNYWLQLAKGEVFRGNLSDAVGKVTEAIDSILPSEPLEEHVRLLIQRCIYNQLNKNFFAAESDLLTALGMQPDNLDVMRHLARLYVLGPADIQKPKRTLQLAIELSLNPSTMQDAALLNGLAYFRLSRWPDSITALKTVEKNSKDYVLAQLFLSSALKKLGRMEESDQPMEEFRERQDEVIYLSSVEAADFRRAAKELYSEAGLP